MPINPIQLYDDTSFKISGVVTKNYSTSFSMATRLLNKEQRDAIYAVYGFVRLADEIVDTFHQYPKKQLLDKLEHDTYESLKLGISTNPILHSFQWVVNYFDIPHKYIEAFITSMKADLEKKEYATTQQANEYIYGSAEVVGLICLKIFTNGNNALFDDLQISAMKLGSTFQKVNFLRDLKYDSIELGRTYFPQINGHSFDEDCKCSIITDIEQECNEAFEGIKRLPAESRFAVLTAYYYYKVLLMKLKKTPAEKILESRIRISNFNKLLLLIKAKLACEFKLF
ncbi:MAG TPA: phytoene/squalene synthase family protein [Mariniphaga sp.]|nr:phytoene/squalene synthase family protein [Mariniphaga sp.]